MSMKKLFLTIMTCAAFTAMVYAGDNTKGFFVSLQGGPLVSSNENTFTYGQNHKEYDLVTLQGAFAVGYNFNDRWGARLSASYGKNASAGNSVQTNPFGAEDDSFYPYTFKSINAFADVIFSISSEYMKVQPKVYLGVGYGRSDDFKADFDHDNQYAWHPWQSVGEKKNVAGVRLGLMPQFNFNDKFGAFADICAEFYGDNFNGQSKGLDLDIRGMLSLGLVYHL